MRIEKESVLVLSLPIGAMASGTIINFWIGSLNMELFIGALLVVAIYILSKISGMPFYIDPYAAYGGRGKSTRLTNRFNFFSLVASSILYCLTLGKLKLLIAGEWRDEKLKEVASEGGVLELKIVAGEIGSGFRRTIRLALKRKYKVILLCGSSVLRDAIEDLKEFLDNPNFGLYSGKERPEKHLAIIGRRHLFLEVPHFSCQRKKYSLGINNAKTELIDLHTKRFNEMQQGMQKITSDNLSLLEEKSFQCPTEKKPLFMGWFPIK